MSRITLTAAAALIVVCTSGSAIAKPRNSLLVLDCVNYSGFIRVRIRNGNGRIIGEAHLRHNKGYRLITRAATVRISAAVRSSRGWRRVASKTYRPTGGAKHNRYLIVGIKRSGRRFYLTP
jgi:hypothetical protein